MEDEREQDAMFYLAGPDEEGCVWFFHRRGRLASQFRASQEVTAIQSQ